MTTETLATFDPLAGAIAAVDGGPEAATTTEAPAPVAAPAGSTARWRPRTS